MKRFIPNWMFLALMLFGAAGLMMTTGCGDDDDDDPEPIVEDGLYLKGDVTAFSDFDTKALLKPTKNEVGQADRADLYEVYMAIEAGSAGFNIVNVSGTTRTTFGPGSGFATVSNPTNDEPKEAFQRGDVAETEAVFTVPSAGLYHVVIDLEVMKAVIAPVKWGIIGGATANGWGGSTALTSAGFDKNSMTFEGTDLELRGGDWKFRYSEGWKIEIDTTYNGGEGIKVNTNYGGAVDALVPGGDNIVNDDPGLYTVTMTWTAGSGHVASLTKTGELPGTNWEGVVLDAVGSGVSSDNVMAVPDPSGWGWGNRMIADNSGIPTIDGELYTWTWTDIVLEAGEGFKLRTLNGEAPANGNGANFDSGYSDIDVANSSANVVDDNNNITVSVKAAYDISIVIDASNNDVKVITITE